ncbi:MAG: CsgG/HfaB family protein [Victivallaceae bacterium]|jgi:TolB-like protein
MIRQILSGTIINRWLASLLAGCLCLATAAADNAAKSVAILNFYDRQEQVHPDGEKLEMLIFARLAEYDNVRMIERKNIDKIMAERKLTADGMTSGRQSLQLGTMLGADFILTGRIYSMDGSVYFSAKLINCRNASVSGIVASYPESMKKEEMLEAFADKAAAQIRKTLETRKN